MQRHTIAQRMEKLEQRGTALEELPGRMDRLESQFVQLRSEMHDGFSAIQEEVRAGDEVTRQTLHKEIQVAKEETVALLRAEIGASGAEIVTALGLQIEKAMRQSRVLYEDLKADIRLLRDGR